MAKPSSIGKQRHLKIAIVHDWLTGMRGGEVVLEALFDLFPNADLYTLLHKKNSVSDKISNRRIVCSFIDKLPFKNKYYRHYLPLFPVAIERFDFHGYDLVFSSSHCVARGVIVPPGVVHICYMHSPMRYVWDMQLEYFPPRGIINKFIIPFFTHYLRLWDYSVRDRVDRYICNSYFVAQRIQRFYGKKAQVISPPCIQDKKDIQVSLKRESWYLVLSALVPYKRIDIAIEAFCHLPNEKLLIVGTGPEEKKLKKMAPDNVKFLGHVKWEDLNSYYNKTSALLFPGKEDFGIVPVEAQAQGCPVIAYGQGGALETIRNKKTGVLFPEQSAESLLQAISIHKKIKYKATDFTKNVSSFTADQFKSKIKKEVGKFFPNRA